MITLISSIIIGYLLINIILKDQEGTSLLLKFFLGGGLGLGVSSQILFYQLLFGDKLNRGLVVLIHAALLIFLTLKIIKIYKHTWAKRFIRFDPKIFRPMGALILFFVPVWIFAKLYPYGGWDAWQVWNFKAKFILLGENHWRNMFDPALWRTSPHYPLFLPLVNVWGWILAEDPSPFVPMFTAILFTFLTVGVLFSGLREITDKRLSVLPALLLVSLPSFVQSAASQYSDITCGYYLLAAVFCLTYGHTEKIKEFTFLSGLFLGFLTFTKNEGALAAIILTGLAFPYILWADKSEKLWNLTQLRALLAGICLTAIPSFLFEIIYSPGNQTFINGLLSADEPSNIYRLKMIFSFFLVELVSDKWQGLWLLLGIGLLLSKGTCFNRGIRIIPIFLASYLLIIFLYYYVNTYFDITWWLAVTLNRVLFAILPTAVFWVFGSLGGESRE
jgi:hypothetical protein